MINIKQAAIKDSEGKVHTLPRPARHHNIIQAMFLLKAYNDKAIQGFILDDDTFIGRTQAAEVALENGQCKSLMSPPNLYSEDLW